MNLCDIFLWFLRLRKKNLNPAFGCWPNYSSWEKSVLCYRYLKNFRGDHQYLLDCVTGISSIITDLIVCL